MRHGIRKNNVPKLSVSLERRVRFEEIDALGIMWHGRYASWLEDGREALGARYGIHYLDFHRQGVEVPLKEFHMDFKAPLRYDQTYTLTASLLWSDAALLDYEYSITDASGSLMTKAATTQLMVTPDGRLLLEQPALYKDFYRRWKEEFR